MNFFPQKKRNIHLSAEARGDLALLEKANVTVTGIFEGSIRIQGELMVEKGATIRGRVSAERIVVKGKICGDVHAIEGVELRSGAELRGDVKASSFLVEREARFWGQCEIIKQSVKERKKTQMAPEETAQFLQVDVDTVIELAEKKKIPASREDNGVWFFDRIDLERWISENSLSPNPGSSVSELPEKIPEGIKH